MAAVLLIRLSGFLDQLSAEALREGVTNLGPLGPIAFVAAYVLAVLGQVPGSVLVAGGVLAYGPVGGLLLSYVGGTSANLASFMLARRARGRSARLCWANSPRVEQLMRWPAIRTIRRRPVMGVLAVRLLLPTAAVASFALALTDVRWSHYLVGSMMGLVPQLLLTAGLFAVIFQGL